MRFLPVLVLLFGYISLQAAEAKDRSDRRQSRQGARVREGVKSGELTRGEAAKLRSQQRRINRTEKRMEADGELSGKEEAKLERMQDRASKNIYRKKHNERERGAKE